MCFSLDHYMASATTVVLKRVMFAEKAIDTSKYKHPCQNDCQINKLILYG